MDNSKSSKKNFQLSNPLYGQSLLEFALILPILLLLMLGIIESGRLLFIYSSVTNAVREGARYGITVGGSPPHYLDCSGITAAADSLALLAPINVQIGYDDGGPVFRGDCATISTLAQTGNNPIQLGDRIIVTATTQFQPVVPIAGLPPINITASTARTILRGVGFDRSIPQPPTGCYSLVLDVSPLVGGTIVETGGTRCPADQRFYQANTTVTIIAYHSPIYYFDHWADDAIPGTCAPTPPDVACNTATVHMTENSSAVAVFDTTLDCHFLTTDVTPPGSGTVTATTPQNCEENFVQGWAEGTLVQLDATANSGFSFTNWSGDAFGVSNPTNVVFVGGDKNVTGHFVANACNALVININPFVGGTVSVDPPQNCPGGWTTGTVVTMTATANTASGYNFSDYSGDVVSTTPVTSVTMNASKVVDLNFSTSATCWTLFVNPNPSVGGSASALPLQNCAGGWTDGTNVTVYAVNNPGYTFNSWQGPVTITSTTPTNVLMDANKSLIVNFDFTGNDLALVKSATRSVQVGDTISYTIRVINNGTVPATSVIVNDQLPGTVTYFGYRSTLGSCSHTSGTVICNLGTLPAGPSSTDLFIYAKANQNGTVVNTARVTAAQTDPFPINNRDTADTVVRQAIDLEVTKTGPANITQGSTMTYTLSVTNHGPGPATNVVVSDTLPSGVQFISTSSPSCSYNGNVDILCFLGTMISGTTQTIDVSVIPVSLITHQGPTVLSAVQDTYIDSFQGQGQTPARDTTNFNGSGIKVNKASNQNTFGLIQFDVSSFSGIVSSAILELDVNLDSTGDTISVYQINGIWDETNVTYNSFSGNYNNILVHATANTSINGKLSFDITNLVTGWVNGSTPNYGILLRGTSNGNFTWNFADKETQPAPKLIITPLATGTNITNRVSVTALEPDSDTTNNSDSVITSVSAGSSFITIAPVCGEAGDSGIVVTGYNWLASENGKPMDILFEFSENPSTTTTIFSSAAYSSVSGSWNETITIPATAIDDYHRIRVQHGVIDVTARFQIPCPSPNLISGTPALIGTQPVTVAAPIQFNVVVTNVGTLAVISQFPVGLYFNPSPAPVTSTTHISQTFREEVSLISGLGVGQSRLITYTVSSGAPYSGTHDVYAVADSDPSPTGKISERYETDNVSSPFSLLAVGPTPPPIPTPTPSPITATIFGRAYIIKAGVRLPQDNVRINLYDEAGGVNTYIGTRYTNASGFYIFSNIPAPTFYTVSGCVNVDGADYYYSISGIPVAANGTVQVDIILRPGICGP